MFSGGVNPSNWSQTGGMNPQGWQTFGGGPDLSFLNQMQGVLGQGANPTTVDPTAASDLFSAAQPYQDAAYQAATRELDPQWQQAQASFDQQMVNQGLAPGSAAYQTALDNFNRSKNDAYSQAQNQAMQQGLAAQAQGFGQGLSQSQLANSLANSLIGSGTSIANQQLGGNAAVTNAMLGGNQALMQALLGGNSNIAQQMIGGAATQGAANAAAGASRYAAGLNHDINQQQLDNNMLIQLLGGFNGVSSYNNQLPGMEQGLNTNLMGYLPSGGGGGSIDVNSPYNNQYNANLNNWNYQNQQANANNNMYANLLGGLMGFFY